jgi:thymidylate synthase (FAD)
MNALTLLDIYKNYKEYEFDDVENLLMDDLLRTLKSVPEVYWFIDGNTEVPNIVNPYIPNPSLLNPVILSEDYTALKDKLTPYELDIHATVTVDWVTDRATGLQAWRHADMTGGCELSQRYVDRGSAGLRIPEFEAEEWLKDEYEVDVNREVQDYMWYKEELIKNGMRQGRAKEIARMLLPNATLTRIIQCRPLRQWKHFFELRDSTHAQKEIMQDTQAIKKAFIESGVEI